MTTGLFITLEGIEGVGKSTQAEFIRHLLEKAGHTVVATREPGGTKVGEAVRSILLEGGELNIDDTTELMLIFSARAQHLQEVIRPALARGETVLCDRFTDATYAYQGAGRGVPPERIAVLEDYVQAGLKPDITLLFDAPVDVGLSRANHRGKADRFESETRHFFEKVRHGYLELAKSEPNRIHVVDAERTEEQVRQEIHVLLQNLKLC
ncbi:MAG: dTMP kinase [Gammaproteobacteria bacterium]